MLKDPRDLFVFEIANNHQGDVEHGKKIIAEVAAVCKRHGLFGAIKFQLRQFDTFIHPRYRELPANKHIPRFLETALPFEDFAELARTVKEFGLVPMSTVFDEASIPVFQRLGFEILKIGSCSARDYPLLRALRQIRKPVVLSTAGLSLDEVDRAVWELDRRPEDLAIMHCVGIYPSSLDQLLLDRISALRQRFPGHRIGFSTHEDPRSTLPIQIASALGATIFEKHVGLAAGDYSLNAYSAPPEALDQWAKAYLAARAMRDYSVVHAREVHSAERAQLRTLEHMSYLRKDVKAGQAILPEDLCFAIPQADGQASAEEVYGQNLEADRDYKSGDPLRRQAIRGGAGNGSEAVLREYTRLTRESGLVLREGTEAEISCHSGIEQLTRHGALLVTLVNESVCKKLILLTAGQLHPSHQHPDREEFMRVLHGDAELESAGKWRSLPREDFCRIKTGEWHSFRSQTGGVIEEITTHYGGAKSQYADPGQRSKKIKVQWAGGQWRWQSQS